MPTTEAQVREVGGLNDQTSTGDWNLFRFANDGQLSAAIANAIAVAAAWIKVRIDPGVYSSADLNIQLILALGEAYLALHFLVPALKSRRVFGTHYAVETEGSERYQELIDVEWLELAQELLSTWLIIEVEDDKGAFARPTLRVGPVIDPLQPGIETVLEELEETLDRARSLSVGLP